MCYYMSESPLNESKGDLRMKHWCLYLHSSFPFCCCFSQDYAIKAEIISSYYHLSLEHQNKKNI